MQEEKDKMNRAKSYLIDTNRYLKEDTLKYCIIISLIFALSFVLMFFCVKAMPEKELGELMISISEMFNDKNVINSDGTLSFWGILINNLRAGLLIMVLGFIPFLFLPGVFVASNGVVLGTVMGIADLMSQENIFMLLLKYILPHGIFEIPALILEGVIGAKICMVICKKIFGKEKQKTFKYHLKGCIGIYLIYVVPMTLIAAFIEAVVLDWIYL